MQDQMAPASGFPTAEILTLVLFAVLVALVTVMAVRAWRQARITPQERERRRRHQIAVTGKVGDGNLLDLQDHFLHYSYAVRGVEYLTTQDISALKELVPADFSALIGPVSVKYDSSNPANSVVITEQWSGLRPTSQGK